MPLSPYIFILCADVLANKIRKNKDIEGITVCGNEINISHYAEDTTMILDGSKKSFTFALLDLELFGEISGLRLSSKKTEILWIGACVGRQDKLCPEKDFKWVADKLKALGVWISSDPMVIMEANYNEKLLKVRNCLSCWEYRRLSLLGKIVVLKSLIASQLFYILSPLPTKHAALDEINNMFYDFLWSGRRDKIKRDVMISDYKNGALMMIDIKSFNKALKSTWVKKYLENDNHGKSKLLFDSDIQDLGGDVIFKGNLNQNDLAKLIHISDAFTTEMLKIWSEISYNGNITSTEHLLSLPLWQNPLVRIGNKPIYYKLPFDSTKATKLIIFQFKLPHRRLATNDFLNKIGIKENDICTFCRTEKESLFQLFWSCSETSFILAGL